MQCSGLGGPRATSCPAALTCQAQEAIRCRVPSFPPPKTIHCVLERQEQTWHAGLPGLTPGPAQSPPPGHCQKRHPCPTPSTVGVTPTQSRTVGSISQTADPHTPCLIQTCGQTQPGPHQGSTSSAPGHWVLGGRQTRTDSRPCPRLEVSWRSIRPGQQDRSPRRDKPRRQRRAARLGWGHRWVWAVLYSPPLPTKSTSLGVRAELGRPPEGRGLGDHA